MIQNEIHPAFETVYKDNVANMKGGFLPANGRIIFMGTFPPPKEKYCYREPFFYYPGPYNRFWNIIDRINGRDSSKLTLKFIGIRSKPENDWVQSINDKIKFANENQIAFLDIFSKVGRMDKSSKNEDLIEIENVIGNDIFNSYLEKVTTVKRILCTYKLAFNRLIELLDLNDKNGRATYKINNRKIEIISIKSPVRCSIEDNANEYEKLIF